MDNRPNLPEPPATEEPPLQQTPDMLNQAANHSSKPPEPMSEPIQIKQPEPAAKPLFRKKWPIVLLIIVAAMVVVSIVAGIVYWVTVLSPIDNILDEQNEHSQMMEQYRIETVDELMEAYQSKSALDCNFSVTLGDESFDINEQADSGWQYHKTTAVGNDSTAIVLAINGDMIYTWGYSFDGEEYANRILWDQLVEVQDDEVNRWLNSSLIIEDAKNSITGLVCVATSAGADFSIPEKTWVDVKI